MSRCNIILSKIIKLQLTQKWKEAVIAHPHIVSKPYIFHSDVTVRLNMATLDMLCLVWRHKMHGKMESTSSYSEVAFLKQI